MQNAVRVGGKGTMRRKKKVVHKTTGGDDKKLTTALKRLQVTNLSVQLFLLRACGGKRAFLSSTKVNVADGKSTIWHRCNSFLAHNPPLEYSAVQRPQPLAASARPLILLLLKHSWSRHILFYLRLLSTRPAYYGKLESPHIATCQS